MKTVLIVSAMIFFMFNDKSYTLVGITLLFICVNVESKEQQEYRKKNIQP